MLKTGNLISNESVVGSLVEREDTDLLGQLALKLDRGSTRNWKHLAVQLDIPRRVYRNFGTDQGHNSALLLLKYLPIFDPELTIAALKDVLEKLRRNDVISVLNSAGIPGILCYFFYPLSFREIDMKFFLSVFALSCHVIKVCCSANQHPKGTIKKKSPYTFAHLVNFSNRCVSHVLKS